MRFFYILLQRVVRGILWRAVKDSPCPHGCSKEEVHTDKIKMHANALFAHRFPLRETQLKFGFVMKNVLCVVLLKVGIALHTCYPYCYLTFPTCLLYSYS